MHASIFAALALAAASVRAVQVTSPDQNTDWGTSGSHTVEWSSVSTDPDTLDVLLVNFASYPTTSKTLQSGVSTSDGSLTVSYPDGSWPEGTGYQIRLVNSDSTAILSNSEQFNITSSGETESSSVASSSSTSSTAASSSSTSSSSSSSSASITTSRVSSSTVTTTATSGSASASASASSSNTTIPGSSGGGTSGSSPVFTFSGAAVVGALGLIGAALV